MEQKTLIKFGRILSWTVLVLGAIHVGATFTPLIRGGLECLPDQNISSMTYMSLICGGSFILSGILLIIMLNRLGAYHFLTTYVLIISVFLGVAGILAILYMLRNPFAWIAFLVNMDMLVIAFLLRRSIRKSAGS